MQYDAAHYYGLYLQVLGDNRRIDIVSLVVEDRRSRFYREVGQLGKLVYQRLRDAIAQIFSIGVVAHIDKRQDRDRRDLRIRVIASEKDYGCGDENEQGCDADAREHSFLLRGVAIWPAVLAYWPN